MNTEKKHRGRYVRPKRRRGMPIVALIVIDILVAGLILLTFAFFHHVLPAIQSEIERLRATEPPVIVTEQPTMPTEAPTAPPQIETEPTETEAPTEPDLRTEWQKKFADKFSDEVVMDEHSYRSAEVSITVETLTIGEGYQQSTYHVADIYIASIDNFTTYTAHNEMRYFATQDVLEMAEASDAILAISGDFLTYQKSGLLVRNGQVYADDSSMNSICVLFADGTMEFYDGRDYVVSELMERQPLQVWSFGPNLLDENGKVCDYYNVSAAVSYPNPRSAIGYYEPGHYCFIVVDGRQDGYSKGLTIPELAKIFEDLGCAGAYNLDGGGSAVMVYDGERYSRQSNGGNRGLGDILVIRDSYYGREAD